jgi:hypothetical protein
MKTCNRCKVTKAASEFHPRRNRGKPGYLDSDCKPCASDRSREVYHARKAAGYKRSAVYKHGSTIKSKYGIDADDYAQMLAAQGGACALCDYVPSPGDKRLCVDHCHKTGAVRALLCHPCNGGLGCFKDSPQLARLAATYLEHFRE